MLHSWKRKQKEENFSTIHHGFYRLSLSSNHRSVACLGKRRLQIVSLRGTAPFSFHLAYKGEHTSTSRSLTSSSSFPFITCGAIKLERLTHSSSLWWKAWKHHHHVEYFCIVHCSPLHTTTVSFSVWPELVFSCIENRFTFFPGESWKTEKLRDFSLGTHDK